MRRAQAGGPDPSAWPDAPALAEPAAGCASTRRGPAAGGEALAHAGGGAPERAHRGVAGEDAAASATPDKSARAIGGGGAAGDGRATARRSGDQAARRADAAGGKANTRRADTRDRQARPDRGAGAELRSAGDQAIGDAGAEDGEAEQRERREDQGQRVGDRRWVVQSRW